MGSLEKTLLLFRQHRRCFCYFVSHDDTECRTAVHMLLAWLVGQMPTVGDVSNHFNPPHPQTFGRPHNQQTETHNKQTQPTTSRADKHKSANSKFCLRIQDIFRHFYANFRFVYAVFGANISGTKGLLTCLYLRSFHV